MMIWTFIINSFWELWQIKAVRVALLCATILFLLVGSYWYLESKARKAEAEAVKERLEKERLEKQNEGLKILINTANIAVEIQKEKEKANAQAINSKVAANNYNAVVGRDSNTGTGNFDAAKRQFCDSFPDDSLCQ